MRNQMKNYMMKAHMITHIKKAVASLTLVTCLFLSGALFTTLHATHVPNNNLSIGISSVNINSGDIASPHLFNSSYHTLHNSPHSTTNITTPASFEEFDFAVRNNSNTAIIVGEVAGSSTNRILWPKEDLRDPDGIFGQNHVVTPILIHHIIFLGDEVADISRGDIISVIEGYYYVTNETQAYVDGFAIGDIMTNRSYWPMETGNRYIIYLVDGVHEVYRYGGGHDNSNNQHNINHINHSDNNTNQHNINHISHDNSHINSNNNSHNTNHPIFSAALREQVYLLDPSDPARARIDMPSLPHYAQWWQDAMEMYGELEHLPWGTAEPLPIQRNRISAGYTHALVTMPDGTLWAWGENNSGQLGNGTRTSTGNPGQTFDHTPTRVDGMEDVVAVSAGGSHTMAITADGSLWGWGNGLSGQLGAGTTAMRLMPAHIMNNVAAVSAGTNHTMAIRDNGSLWGWGNNSSGQLGDGTTANRHSPIRIMNDVIAVSVGNGHAMAIKSDGSLWGWGLNTSGQLGDGTTVNRHSPVKIMDDVIYVSAGSTHTVAIKSDGSLWVWGINNNGQLGDGTTTNRHSPVWIMDDVVSVSTGSGHTMAIGADGSLWGWGVNRWSEIGDGTWWNQHSPVRIMNDDTVEISTSTGSNGFTIAARADGSVWGWGFNERGQLGDTTTVNRRNPVIIKGEVPPTINTPSDGLPIGTVNWTYGHNFVINAIGSRPMTWTIIDGAIPPGLTLNPSLGSFTGTPTAAGEFEFTLQVSNNFGYATQTFSLTVRPEPFEIWTYAPDITASPGEYIDVTIRLGADRGFWQSGLSVLNLDISYDASMLQRVGEITLGNVLDAPITQPPTGSNPLRVNLGTTNAQGFTNDTGDLMTIRFRVLDDTPAGTVTHVEVIVIDAYRVTHGRVTPMRVDGVGVEVTIID